MNDAIKKRMKERNLTVEDLAIKIDCDINRIAELLKNRAKWKIFELLYVADELSLSIDELLGVGKPKLACSHKGSLGTRLKEVRLEAEISRLKVENEHRLSCSVLRRWESGDDEIRAEKLAGYANYIGFSIDDILGRADTKR